MDRVAADETFAKNENIIKKIIEVYRDQPEFPQDDESVITLNKFNAIRRKYVDINKTKESEEPLTDSFVTLTAKVLSLIALHYIVNFSSNDYTPPSEYRKKIAKHLFVIANITLQLNKKFDNGASQFALMDLVLDKPGYRNSNKVQLIQIMGTDKKVPRSILQQIIYAGNTDLGKKQTPLYTINASNLDLAALTPFKINIPILHKFYYNNPKAAPPPDVIDPGFRDVVTILGKLNSEIWYDEPAAAIKKGGKRTIKKPKTTTKKNAK